MYFVYIIQSVKFGTYYTGVTVDLERRLKEHNSGLSKYSSTKRPFIYIWSCSFKDKEKAYSLEEYLKTGSGIAFRNKHLI